MLAAEEQNDQHHFLSDLIGCMISVCLAVSRMQAGTLMKGQISLSISHGIIMKSVISLDHLTALNNCIS